MATNNKISVHISEQSPFFVRNDHPNFVAFMEAYYEYLEQSNTTLQFGKTIERGKNLPNYFDVDKTLDDFSELLYNHFLKFLPRDIIADKDLIIKHVLDFYKARGSEKATRFLFNILFNKPISFYYPKRDVLRASDGKWIIDRYLNVSNVAVQNVSNSTFAATQKFITTKVFGQTSKASAIVDDVLRSTTNGVTIDKLQISSLRGVFIDGEPIYSVRYNENNSSEYLTARLLNDSISSVVITDPGTSYNIGDYVIVESSNGSGANIVVSSVSQGELIDVVIAYGGAGFQITNPLVFTGTSGSGAAASVTDVNDSGYYHSNTFNIYYTTIASEANTPISNAIYSNLSTSIVTSPNANSALVDVLQSLTLTGLGPITDVDVSVIGSGYVMAPSVDVTANTMLRDIGALGRLEIIRPGTDYEIGDQITFTNLPGQFGFGALANVTNVSGIGGITKVDFVQYNDEPLGGSGYTSYPIPVISSANGTGAEIAVSSIMGDGESLISIVDTFGKIKAVTIVNGGSGYSNVSLNLQSSGDGTAKAYALISAKSEEGFKRYLNDDGMISSYNFLQNRDYYQNYSYVISVRENIYKYRDAMKNLLHPTGMKMFGEYDYLANNSTLLSANLQVEPVLSDSTLIKFASYAYSSGSSLATLVSNSHGFVANNNVYIEFLTTNELDNNTYFVLNSTTNQFNVRITAATTNSNGSAIVYTTVV